MVKFIDTEAHAAATSTLNLRALPTEPQRNAGNYKLGHIRIGGLDISIENPAGSRRRPEWPEMTAHYGYVRRTKGADGDHVDAFVRPGTPDDWRGDVYVVDQYRNDGKFDEHKCMLGYDTQRQAEQAYLGSYQRGWKLGPVTAMPFDEFKAWLKGGDTKAPVAKADLAALVKFDPEQARDEGGRWTSDVDAPVTNNLKGTPEQPPLPFGPRHQGSIPRHPKTVLAFHGTSSEALGGIRKEGLIPKKGAGADTWAEENGFHTQELLLRDGALSVFLSPDPTEASKYAQLAAEVTGSKPVLIRLNVPVKEINAGMFEPDFGGDRLGVRTARPIPREWIDDHYFELTPNNAYGQKLLEQLGKADVATKTYFMVVLVDDGVAKFDQTQPRDDYGRWTDAGAMAGMREVDYAVNIRRGPRLDNRKGGRKIEEVGAFFDLGGPIPWQETDDMTDEQREQVRANVAKATDTMEREIRFQLSQERSGLNWYDEDIKDAFEITEKHIPGLADPGKQVLFATMAGIMSPSSYAHDNWLIAAQAFDHYAETGEIPGRNPENGQLWRGGVVSVNKEGALNGLNRLVQTLGEEEAIKWLVSDHSALSLAYARESYGLGGTGGFTLKGSGDMAPGYSMFGPKVGQFIANINGVDGVTVDRWATRTHNRYFKSVLGSDGKVNDVPSDKQRVAIKSMMTDVANRVGIKPQQAQAAMWFFEQQLYSHMGTASKDYFSYSDGARMYDEWKTKKGVGKVLLSSLLPSMSGVPSADPSNEADLMVSAMLRRRLGLDASIEKFDPDQPRDEAGRWTAGGGGSASPPPEAYESKSLSRDQVDIEFRLAGKLGMEFTGYNDKGEHQFKVTDQAAFQRAVAEYGTRPDARGGKVLNTDTARELSPEYLSDRTQSAAVHEPASEFIKELYKQKLAEPIPEGQEALVMFTAGGTGAGKSTGLELPEVVPMVEAAHIIYDTNMNTFSSADKKIAQAINAGHQVSVMYVARDPLDALVRGALPRAVNQEKEFGTGRTVPISEHVKTHVGALTTVTKIRDKWAPTGKLGVIAVNNSLGRGNARVEPIENMRLAPTEQLEGQLYAALDEQYQQGAISESIYRGFGGARAKGAPTTQKAVESSDLSARVDREGWRAVRGSHQQAGNRTSLTGLLKFDPGQERDERGRWSSGGGGEQKIFFEVAPDPKDEALTKRWNTLSTDEKIEVSKHVAEKITPSVLAAAGVHGQPHMQIGGYEGATNPSFAVDVPRGEDASRLVPAASLLGYALSQDSMMVVSDKQFAGSDPTGVITVHLDDESFAKAAAVYDRLWKLEEGGQKLVGGHSTSRGQMNILNFSGLPNDEFARRIDEQLGGRYQVDVRHAFVAFPQRADYGQNLPTGVTVPAGQPTGQRLADRLRGEAAGLIEQELRSIGKADLGRLLKEFVASTSATSGLTAYGNTPKRRKKNRRRPRGPDGKAINVKYTVPAL
jgi:hypothetical protein